jgi:ketosteroid isomerase-like protein
MTQPNEDLVRAASAAFGRGDLSVLQDQFFAADIVWHIAGTGPLAGDYEGVAQVMGLLGKIAELSAGTVRPELHDVLVSNDHTVALTTIRAERAGKQPILRLRPAPGSAVGSALASVGYSSATRRRRPA